MNNKQRGARLSMLVSADGVAFKTAAAAMEVANAYMEAGVDVEEWTEFTKYIHDTMTAIRDNYIENVRNSDRESESGIVLAKSNVKLG